MVLMIYFDIFPFLYFHPQQDYVRMEVYHDDNSYLEIDGEQDVTEDDDVFIDERQINCTTYNCKTQS